MIFDPSELEACPWCNPPGDDEPWEPSFAARAFLGRLRDRLGDLFAAGRTIVIPPSSRPRRVAPTEPPAWDRLRDRW